MGKVIDQITAELKDFIESQPLFFVATAPLSPEGHVNLSPKGLDCLRVLSPCRIAYLDLTGSGNETAAHVLENGRITFMFSAFTGRPKILRLYGTAQVVLPESTAWKEMVGLFPDYPGMRQIIIADIDRVQTSCGFAVPLMDLVGERDNLIRWAEAKGESLPLYRKTRNAVSIDGLPAPVDPSAP